MKQHTFTQHHLAGPRRRLWLAALAAPLLVGSLGGCAQYYYGEYGASALPGPGPQPRAQLVQASHAAIDALLEQTRLEPGVAVLVASLVNVDRLDQSSRLGRAVSEQLGGRLVQRGIPVAEVRLREHLALQPGQGELLLSRELREVSQAHHAQAALVGTYAVGAQQVFISIKLVLPEASTVVAAHDYAVPLDQDVRSMLVPR